MTIIELATTYFDIKEAIIYSEVGSKEFSNFEIDGLIRFRRDEIDEGISAQLVGVGGDRIVSRSRGRARRPRNTCGDRIVREVIAGESGHIPHLVNSAFLLSRRATQ